MKKILAAVVLWLLCIQNGFSMCNTDHTLTFKGNQKPEHDEFLYLSEYQYKASVEGYKNTKKQNSGSGKAYECDGWNTSGCSAGETVTMPAGHVFGGVVVNTEQKYECTRVLFNDKWVAVGDCMCCNSIQFGNIPVGGAYSRNISKAECSSYNKTDETHGKMFQLRCLENRNLLCFAVECDDSNMVPNSNGICVAKKKPDPNNDVCKANIKGSVVTINRGAESSIDLTAAECSVAVKVAHGGGSMDQNGIYHFFCGPTCKKVGCKQGYENDEKGMCVKKGGDKKTCRERRAGMSIEAIACCDTGTDAVWDSPIKGKCNCKDSNTHFEIVGGRGQCVANITPPPVIIPPVVPQPCSDPDNMDSNCKCIVVGTVERGGKCVCRDDNQEIKNGKCEWTAKYVAGLESDLDSKFNSLTATIGGFEKNVWRDENGEFNTARLASDSIAGVVLGTVGGIVTANLVKKAQVKQGFEDIGCYIGGQSVAGYGDEFNVGR